MKEVTKNRKPKKRQVTLKDLHCYEVRVWSRHQLPNGDPVTRTIAAPNMKRAKNLAEHELGKVISIKRLKYWKRPDYSTYTR